MLIYNLNVIKLLCICTLRNSKLFINYHFNAEIINRILKTSIVVFQKAKFRYFIYFIELRTRLIKATFLGETVKHAN